MAKINPDTLPVPYGYWNSLTTFLPNSNVYPIADGAVYGKMLQQQTGNIQILNNELAAQLFNFNYDTKKLDQKSHPNPTHPSNTTLGTAHADPRSWKERPVVTFESKGMTGYTNGKKSDLVKVLHEMGKDGQAQASSHRYNVINDPEAYRAQQQKMYEELFKNVPESRPNSNPSHPSNATLGSAHADPRSWKERPVVTFKSKGMTGYTNGKKSGVVKTAQNIANNVNTPELTKKTGFNFNNLNWKKIGKYAIFAGLALAGAAAIGSLIAKYANNDKKEVKQEEVNPESTTTVANVSEEPNYTINLPEVIITPGNNTEKTDESDNMQGQSKLDPNSPIDADGKMTVQKGDGLWHIAERYLEYKFKNEPDKFNNLSESEKNQMIWKEVHRIADLNGFELVTKIVNGKEVMVTEPMIHPEQEIQVVKKMDIAA